jgi:hypothetical protein
MNIDKYNEKCHELAVLASEAINLEGLDQKTKDELESTRKSILSNHYRITLLGGYQGGKSTIFDTACGGGRELSPTGIGLRTSAVPAEAHAIEEGQKEHAIITWKTDQELLSGFIDAISPELRELDKDRFSGLSEIEIVELLNLENNEDLELTRIALSKADEHMRKEIESGTIPSLSHGELLKIGSLAVRFYDDFRMTANLSTVGETKVTVEDATRIVGFPKKWATPEDVRSLTWNDVRFIYAKSVAFHVVSHDLSRLRAVLVDCPGLHASRWDNEIVHQCISRSDAIIWLQGSQGRELGQDELAEARRFADYGITSDGIFLAFNANGISQTAAPRILESNLSKMKQEAGLEIPMNRVVVFNALLALRCKQAIAKNKNTLTRETIDALSAKAIDQLGKAKLPNEGKDPENNAIALIKSDVRRVSMNFLNDDVDNPWDPETLDRLLGESQWEQVISQATQFIVDTKGRTRLIARGAQPIMDAISVFEENLRFTEDRANQNLAEHKKKRIAADTALKEFETMADGLVRRFQNSINDINGDDNGVGAQIKGELLLRFVKGKKSLPKALTAVIENSTQERDVRNGIRDAATDWMKRIISGWQLDVRAGKSPAMRDFYQQTLNGVGKDMKDLLQNAIGKGAGLLGEVVFKVPQTSDHLLGDYQAKPMQAFKDVDWILDKTDKLSIFRPLRDGYEALRRRALGTPFDRGAWEKRSPLYVRDLSETIEEEVLDKIAMDFLSGYRDAVVSQMDASKSKLRDEYQERIRITEEDLSRGQEERNRMAKRAKDIRKGVIAPFRERVETFISETENSLPEMMGD